MSLMFSSKMSRGIYSIFCFAGLLCILRYFYLFYYLDFHVVKFTHPPQTYGNYCVRPTEFAGKVEDYDRVALILHASADFVNKEFEDQINNWDAPISLAVYLDDPGHQANCMLDFFTELFASNEIASNYLTVHFVYKPGPDDCEVRARACHGLKKDVPYPIQAEYPANLLRNVARLQHSSKYILIGDFDHLFSRGFERRMLSLADRENITATKSALVYRLFEVEPGEEDPLTKQQLLNLIEDERAFTFHALFLMPFYRKSPLNNPHYIEGERGWLRRPDNENETKIADTLTYDNAKWEPQFVSSSLIPLHDESFPYRIRDNTCLRWEMCRAGYKWLLVEDLFMFHRGVKRYGQASNKDSGRIQKLNMPKFHQALSLFHERVYDEYPATRHSCPVCRINTRDCM